MLIARNAVGDLLRPSSVIADAHRRGLVVHGWTFRRENRFLPASLRSGPDLEAPGDLVGELRVFLAAGMDGFFTDNPDLGVRATAHRPPPRNPRSPRRLTRAGHGARAQVTRLPTTVRGVCRTCCKANRRPQTPST